MLILSLSNSRGHVFFYFDSWCQKKTRLRGYYAEVALLLIGIVQRTVKRLSLPWAQLKTCHEQALVVGLSFADVIGSRLTPKIE